MKTPKEYIENLKNRTITTEMLADCLYSVNKRAKNYRDAGYAYRYSDIGLFQYSKMADFYNYKEEFLSYLEPICIHKQEVYYETYDYEMDDYDEGTKCLYFLYYDLGTHSFHTPIDSPKDFNLPVVDIDEDFYTYGKNPSTLISMQFVNKVLHMLKHMNCKLVLLDRVVEFTDRIDKPFPDPKPKKEPDRPTESQLKYIQAICECYKIDVPELKTKWSASQWLRKITKERNVQGDLKRAETEKRNEEIYSKYKKETTVEDLSQQFNLTIATIKKIIKNKEKACNSK